MAIDERRRPYREYRFDADALERSEGRYREMWFAGVHSDVGGLYEDDHRLSDIAFAWMVAEAVDAGLQIRKQVYRHMLGVKFGGELDPARVDGVIHPNSRPWMLAGGWRTRPMEPRRPRAPQRQGSDSRRRRRRPGPTGPGCPPTDWAPRAPRSEGAAPRQTEFSRSLPNAPGRQWRGPGPTPGRSRHGLPTGRRARPVVRPSNS